MLAICHLALIIQTLVSDGATNNPTRATWNIGERVRTALRI